MHGVDVAFRSKGMPNAALLLANLLAPAEIPRDGIHLKTRRLSSDVIL